MKSKIETDTVSTFLGKLIDKHTKHICGQFVYINNHLVIVLEAPLLHPSGPRYKIEPICVDITFIYPED